MRGLKVKKLRSILETVRNALSTKSDADSLMRSLGKWSADRTSFVTSLDEAMRTIFINVNIADAFTEVRHREDWTFDLVGRSYFLGKELFVITFLDHGDSIELTGMTFISAKANSQVEHTLIHHLNTQLPQFEYVKETS